MWFKNATLLKLPADFRIDALDFETALASQPLRSPGPLEHETHGFLSIFPPNHIAGDTVEASLEPMSRTLEGATLFSLGTESRLLPSSVINDAIADRVAEHEAKTGRKPGKRLRNEFRELALCELLPRAFIKRARTAAYWDATSNMLIVDTASDKASELVATCVREALGSFPARPVACQEHLAGLMTHWVGHGNPPEGFELDDYCLLVDPADKTSKAKFTNHDLSAEEVREHVYRGKQCVELGLVFEQRIAFVLDSSCKLRKIEYLDVIADKLDGQDGGDPAQVLDAEFTLMALELRRLVAALDGVVRFVS